MTFNSWGGGGTVEVCSNLLGKRLHRQLSVEKSDDIMEFRWRNHTTLAMRARHVVLDPALGATNSHFHQLNDTIYTLLQPTRTYIYMYIYICVYIYATGHGSRIGRALVVHSHTYRVKPMSYKIDT